MGNFGSFPGSRTRVPPPEIKAHSTRVVGASSAVRHRVIADGFASGTWSSIHTFRRTTADSSLGRRTLQAAVGILKIFYDDNFHGNLPDQFRQSVLRELFQKVQQGNDALIEVCYKVCACNTVRDILRGGTETVQFHQLFMKPSKEKI
ncbi:unnamed protein product [Ranitomeya imitator]|uniref:Uncharacterized protein n=1 Tax=Ranitomeya imitator TaxID=111125 RepID=A0ABN9MAY8_9NEOB|nr:unnamed protein product [Ranitomeya imitator]